MRSTLLCFKNSRIAIKIIETLDMIFTAKKGNRMVLWSADCKSYYNVSWRIGLVFCKHTYIGTL